MAHASALNTLTAADKRIQQLGRTMFNLKQETGAATRQLLIAEGFSRHELDTYGDAGAEYARGLEFRDRDASRQGFTKTDEEIVAISVEAGLGLVGDAQIANAALGRGLQPDQIARNWPKITRLLALKVGTLPLPKSVAA